MTNRLYAALLCVLSVAGVSPADLVYPVGFKWEAQQDWTKWYNHDGSSIGNPDDDLAGVPVWSYERAIYVPGQGGLNTSQPWYEADAAMLVWQGNWYGQFAEGQWVHAINTIPMMRGNIMAHGCFLSDGAPLRRWMNPSQSPLEVDVTMLNAYIRYNAGWSSADVAICLERQDTRTLLYGKRYAPDADLLTYLDPVDLGTISILPGDSLILTMRYNSNSGQHWDNITMVGGLEITVVPEPATLLLLSLGSLLLQKK